jgi:WD40 repeat protein
MAGESSPDLMTTTIRIWDAETGAVVSKPLEGHSKCVLSVAYSPDGQAHHLWI